MDKITIPLHPSQFEVYVDQLVHPDSPHYNIGLYIKLFGNIDIGKLYKTIYSSVDVFDVFKMKLMLSGPEPLCYFDEHAEMEAIGEIDFSDQERPGEYAKNWMQNRFNSPFQIQNERALYEYTILKITPGEQWFFFRFHHLIIDGYGLTLWVNYIAKTYSALLENKRFQAYYPSYQQVAVEAAKYRASGDYELDEKYWIDRLGEKPEALLTKTISPSVDRHKKSSNYYVTLSEAQKGKLDEVLRTTNSSLHQLTTAALLIYFGKISDKTTVTFGLPVNRRGFGELRRVVGMFSGVLPFKAIFRKEILLKELLHEIATARKSDYSHQNFLIVDLVKSMNIESAESFFYDVIVNYVPYNFELDFGWEVKPLIYSLQSEQGRVPLQICWRDYGNHQPMELGLHYRHEYFSPEEIALLVNRILFILDQFPGSMGAAIGNISILPEEECRLLEQFNATGAIYPQDKSIVDLFEEQVKRTPAQVAVVFGAQRFSYRELDKRASQLGQYLRGKGVQAETLVPICMERSLHMMVGILGILKAGGAYVPLDPEYPQARLSYMLQDTQASLVLCTKASRSKLPVSTETEAVEVDSEWSNIAQQGNHQLPVAPRPHHLAYVIYTSGSTGAPKGVMIEHGSLVASTMARMSYYHSLGSVLLVPSFSFDSSVAVIFGTLLTGGRLILCDAKSIMDVGFLREQLKLVDTLLCVPSYYRLLLEEGIVKASSLSTVIVAGESLDEALVNKHFAESNGVSLYNEYGPTEYTIWATVAKMEASDSKVSIGTPIDNTTIYIVGRDGLLNPVGVAGEICIAGAGLARGYLNNEDLTQQKFIFNPFSKKHEGLMYKTGDVGRFLPNGKVEFIGRKDNQVKIRGYRIELGEVESAVLQCEQISQAVVVAQQGEQGDLLLVGYVVTLKNKLDRETLAQYLFYRLPQYMIPAVWVEMEQLPLTANGKIDRASLPKVNTSESAHTPYEAPRNEVETQLSTIWQLVLKVEKVGIHDNFFELGGDSIRAIRVVSRANSLGYQVLTKDLFLYQTIAKLSKVIASDASTRESAGKVTKSRSEGAEIESLPVYKLKSLIPAKTAGAKAPLYLICGGGGTIFTFQNLISLLDVSQPVYVLQQPTSREDFAAFPTDIKGIATRYIEEIVTVNPHGPYALAGHCIGGVVAYEMANQFEARGLQVKLLVLFDTVAQEMDQLKTNSFTGETEASKLFKFLLKLYAKAHFEAFLLRNHTRHAVAYKFSAMKAWLGKHLPFLNTGKENDEFKIFSDLEYSFASAYKNYQLAPSNHKLVVFYAQYRYHFLDKERNISYGKFQLSDTIRNRWSQYVPSLTIHEVDGEHNSMFDPEYGGVELAQKLQGYLDTTF